LNLLGQAIVARNLAVQDGAYIPACHAFGWDPPNAIFLGSRRRSKNMQCRRSTPATDFVAISESSGGSDPAAPSRRARKNAATLRIERHQNLDIRSR